MDGVQRIWDGHSDNNSLQGILFLMGLPWPVPPAAETLNKVNLLKYWELAVISGTWNHKINMSWLDPCCSCLKCPALLEVTPAEL